MSLLDIIREIESDEMALTVYNADADVLAELRERFADRSVVVEEAATPDGKPENYVTLSERGVVVSATAVTDLFRMFEDGSVTGLDTQSYRPVLDYLDETLFTSWDPKQMLSATREIEDRAWRLRRGQLHVGFQRMTILQNEGAVYRRLAESDLLVHVYTTPNGDPPDLDGATVHVTESEDVAKCWFLAFDGDGDDDQKCALLAEEREPRSYYGFWTYDPDTVDRILGYLQAVYSSAESCGET